MLLFYPLCYDTVLLKFTYYAQEQEFLHTILHGNSLHVADNFYTQLLYYSLLMKVYSYPVSSIIP